MDIMVMVILVDCCLSRENGKSKRYQIQVQYSTVHKKKVGLMYVFNHINHLGLFMANMGK